MSSPAGMPPSAPSSPRPNRASTSTGSGSAAAALFASGDGNPYDNVEHRFDAIFENPIFAGADTSYWIRQAIPFAGGGRAVTFTGRNGVLIDLRSSKEQGQSNFVNPGTVLLGVGADFDLTPRVRLSTNLNHLWFQRTAVIQALRIRAHPNAIGWDLARPGSTGRCKIQNLVFPPVGRDPAARAPAFSDLLIEPTAPSVIIPSCSTRLTFEMRDRLHPGPLVPWSPRRVLRRMHRRPRSLRPSSKRRWRAITAAFRAGARAANPGGVTPTQRAPAASAATRASDAPTMHTSPAVVLGCVDCHGGNPAVRASDVSDQNAPAYVAGAGQGPRAAQLSEVWHWPSSANPQRSYTLLNRESPGIRPLRQSVGLPGGTGELRRLPHRSDRGSRAVADGHRRNVLGGAAYNNGILPFKNYMFGEAYTSAGRAGEDRLARSWPGRRLLPRLRRHAAPLPSSTRCRHGTSSRRPTCSASSSAAGGRSGRNSRR